MDDLAFGFFLLLALGLGLAAGWFLAVWTRRDDAARRELERRLQEKERELEKYREEVDAHFRKTADLFHELTEKYREVFVHLAGSAQQLCGEKPPALQADIQTTERLAHSPATRGRDEDETDGDPLRPAPAAPPEREAESEPAREGKKGGEEEDEVLGDAPHVPDGAERGTTAPTPEEAPPTKRPESSP